MSRHSHSLFVNAALLLAALVCTVVSLSGQASKTASPAPPPNQTEKMTAQTRLLVMRSLQSERVFARIMLPQGDKGIKIKNGVLSPSEAKIAQEIAEYGPAARPGDRCVITDVQIKDNQIIRRTERRIEKASEVVPTHSGHQQCRGDADPRWSQSAEPRCSWHDSNA